MTETREFEWDPAKRVANLLKHGIDFVGAVGIFTGDVLEVVDLRREYGEVRRIAIGMVRNEVLTVVYTPRGPARRIISARRSSTRERQAYAAALEAAARPD